MLLILNLGPIGKHCYYNAYVSQVNEPFSVTDFSVGFAKGLPKGIYDSGEGMSICNTSHCHPVQTGEKVYDSISTLSSLAKSGEWNQIGEALSPELHQLVSNGTHCHQRKKGSSLVMRLASMERILFFLGQRQKWWQREQLQSKNWGLFAKTCNRRRNFLSWRLLQKVELLVSMWLR